jgi:3-hydroxybutyryl-CoA dehydrogenase
MKAEDIRIAAVIGAGTLGHGIAQVLATAGIETRLYDVMPGMVERGLGSARANLDKGVEKGKVDAKVRDAAVARLSGTTKLEEALDGAQCAVEAVPEKLELKQTIFADLGKRLGPEVLLGTNTSSLSVTRIAAVTPHPPRVVGLHFFNPVHLMKLVEVVAGDRSSEEAVTTAMDLARRLGKDPIRVKDSPGFATSRLGVLVGLEAIRMLESGVASAKDIDKAMTLGYGFPMGPLALSDLVGLDVRLSIADHLAKEIGPRFEPPQLLRDKVKRGELGKKTGKGFHDWNRAE